VAESAGEKLIDPPSGGWVSAPATAGPRTGTPSGGGFRRSRVNRRYHATVLSYLQDFPVLDPGQVLAGVVTQLTNSDNHASMLPHM
jgi:hypothetical protein